MKGLLLSALIAGGAAALLLYFADELSGKNNEVDDIGEAAEDAYKTIDRQINKVERKTESLIDPALG